MLTNARIVGPDGVVDLHTDAQEKQMMPRAGVHWAPRAAVLAHDANVAAAGITTVFDSLCVGEVEWHDGRNRIIHEAIAELHSVAPKDLLRAEHFLHLRCEISVEGTVELFDSCAPDPDIAKLIRLVSLMDYTPGDRRPGGRVHARRADRAGAGNGRGGGRPG